MKSCSKCGSAVPEGASFCGICGAPVTAANSNAVGGPPAAPPASVGAAGGLTSNMAAALAYLAGFITGIIFLCIEPYKRDPFVRFHAFQSICFSIVIIVIGIIWSNLLLVGFFAWGILTFVWFLFRLAIFAYWLFLMYKAYNNEGYMIPVIGPFAFRQAGKES